MVAHDFAAHHAEKVQVQARQVFAQFVQLAERQFAHVAVFQRHGIAGIGIAAQPVHAHHFARHEKAGYLVAAVLRIDGGFEKTGADGEQ